MEIYESKMKSGHQTDLSFIYIHICKMVPNNICKILYSWADVDHRQDSKVSTQTLTPLQSAQECQSTGNPLTRLVRGALFVVSNILCIRCTI